MFHWEEGPDGILIPDPHEREFIAGQDNFPLVEGILVGGKVAGYLVTWFENQGRSLKVVLQKGCATLEEAIGHLKWPAR